MARRMSRVRGRSRTSRRAGRSSYRPRRSVSRGMRRVSGRSSGSRHTIRLEIHQPAVGVPGLGVGGSGFQPVTDANGRLTGFGVPANPRNGRF